MGSNWLTLEGICDVLHTDERHVTWLAKNGYIEVLWGPGRTRKGARFLDPTPEYAERLRKSELLYGRRQPLPEDFDLPNSPIFTARELGEIMGWDYERTQRFLYKKRKTIKAVPLGRHATAIRLFSAATIRDLIWTRNDRSQSKQRAPFLVKEILEWFLRFRQREEQEVPTDTEFQEDDLLQRKLTRLMKMPSPQREAAIQEFLEKVDLAKSFVQAKEAAG
jgi:hypothetical protein